MQIPGPSAKQSLLDGTVVIVPVLHKPETTLDLANDAHPEQVMRTRS